MLDVNIGRRKEGYSLQSWEGLMMETKGLQWRGAQGGSGTESTQRQRGKKSLHYMASAMLSKLHILLENKQQYNINDEGLSGLLELRNY